MMTMGIVEGGLEGSLSNLVGSEAFLLLTRVSGLLTEQNIEAYVVGGLVRDVLCGRDTDDIDIAIAADALEVAPKLAAALGGTYVLLDRVNRVGRVVLVDKGISSTKIHWNLDFSTIKDNIRQDLARRDFTIDAMAFDLSQVRKDCSVTSAQLVDPFNGREDLQRGVIRVVAETAFTSDASRLLRAVRLAAELGFSIDTRTEVLIRHDSHLIASIAGERVREELLGLLAVSRAGQFLTYLDKLELLTSVFPELAPARGVVQPREHYWDVFDHSLETVIAIEFLLRQGDWEHTSQELLASVPWSATLARHFDLEVSSGSTRGLLLKLAALLHDIGKPQTKAIEADGRMHFLGHAGEGATMTANIMERLRFSAKEIKLVEILIQHHLRPGQMSQDELPTHRAIYRYFRDTGEAGIDILFLSLADHLATRGSYLDISRWREHTRIVDYVLSQHFQEESIVRPPKLIDGHDLINVFGMNPGPGIGEILETVREAQATGGVTTREEALAYIRDHLLSKRSD
ncbi:MAG: HD domain-containing protein [Dehalococcoidales bacterium]|nr:HD domain-containing protein [Dehalococcoidales bacterium]